MSTFSCARDSVFLPSILNSDELNHCRNSLRKTKPFATAALSTYPLLGAMTTPVGFGASAPCPAGVSLPVPGSIRHTATLSLS